MEVVGIKAASSVRLAPVGACIYCGVIDGRLTEEHIIPKGLGGTLVLPQSSCNACAAITSLFEMRVLRGFLDRGRQAMGIKGRKTHKRVVPETVAQAFIQPDDSIVELDVPWDDGLKVMHLPVFVLPAFLDSRRPLALHAQEMEIMAIDTLHFGIDEGKLAREHKAKGIRFEDRLDVWAFVRLLAKIAHGYHVAIYGQFPLNESPLLPIILGRRRDAVNWIGNTLQDPLPSGGTALHLIQHLPLQADDGSGGTAVRIKLFAAHSTPTYALATRLTAPTGLPDNAICTVTA